MKILNQIAQYLYLKKKNPNEHPTQWTKYMHGINRFTIIIFLLGLTFLIFKNFILPKFK